jgi:hypothetical protein
MQLGLAGKPKKARAWTNNHVRSSEPFFGDIVTGPERTARVRSVLTGCFFISVMGGQLGEFFGARETCEKISW